MGVIHHHLFCMKNWSSSPAIPILFVRPFKKDIFYPRVRFCNSIHANEKRGIGSFRKVGFGAVQRWKRDFWHSLEMTKTLDGLLAEVDSRYRHSGMTTRGLIV